MVNRRRSNRPSRRNGSGLNSRQPVRFRRAISRTTTGVRFVPPVDPPEYVSAPWWPMTLILIAVTDETVTAQKLYQQVLEQLDVKKYVSMDKSTVPLEMRIDSVRAWGLARQPIQLSVYDRLGKHHRVAEISDYGTPIQYSRVGWRFGSIAHADALGQTETDVLYEISGATSTNKILLYNHILIRIPNAPKPVQAASIALRSQCDRQAMDFDLCGIHE